MLAKQIYEIALDNNPGTPRFHGTCNALVDVNIGTDAAKRDTGAKAADRSACDRNGEVGLGHLSQVLSRQRGDSPHEWLTVMSRYFINILGKFIFSLVDPLRSKVAALRGTALCL
jgi:hypothetical protein